MKKKYIKLSEGLKSIGMYDKYIKIFIREELEDNVLPDLTEEKVKYIKELTLGAQVKFMGWLNEYKKQLVEKSKNKSDDSSKKKHINDDLNNDNDNDNEEEEEKKEKIKSV